MLEFEVVVRSEAKKVSLAEPEPERVGEPKRDFRADSTPAAHDGLDA
jgi:hypothetical protein